MVHLSKLTMTTALTLIASIFPTLSGAWEIGLYSTQVHTPYFIRLSTRTSFFPTRDFSNLPQDSCGGDWAPDTSRSGDSAVTSDCIGFGFNEIQAMRVLDWADHCKIVAYDQIGCDNALWDFTKERYPPSESDPNWTCINGLRNVEDLVNWRAFRYECE